MPSREFHCLLLYFITTCQWSWLTVICFHLIFFSHSIGSGPFTGELESLLFTYGGSWSGFNDISDMNSWVDSPYLDPSTNPRRISYTMFRSVYDQTDNCLAVLSRSGAEEDDLLTGECWSEVSFDRTGSSTTSSFEVSKLQQYEYTNCKF